MGCIPTKQRGTGHTQEIDLIFEVVLVCKNSELRISKKRTVSYVLVANIVSFIGGMTIAQFVPDIF